MSATGQSIVDNWKAAMTSGTARNKYVAGINAVTENPMEKAAAAVENGSYMAGVQAAISSGKMVRKLRGASLQNWKANATGPGANNLQSGATKGLAKMQAASQQIAAAGAAGKAAAAQVQGAEAKMLANMRAIKAAWGYGS